MYVPSWLEGPGGESEDEIQDEKDTFFAFKGTQRARGGACEYAY